MGKITIAIDGFAGCGKSTTARRVARDLNYIYIDSGAMYRAVTLYMNRHHIPIDYETPELLHALNEIILAFARKDENVFPEITLNGEYVEDFIRRPEVSEKVSQVSALGAVRREMVRQQRLMGEEKGIIMDGRDIGTVVFPLAEIKIFMTASPEIRAQRRFDEMNERGLEADYDSILKNILDRDYLDSNRKDSPLRQAENAIVIDTSNLTIDEQVNTVKDLARDYIEGSCSRSNQGSET